MSAAGVVVTRQSGKRGFERASHTAKRGGLFLCDFVIERDNAG